MTDSQIAQQLEAGVPLRTMLSSFPSSDAAYAFLANYATKRFPRRQSEDTRVFVIEWRIIYWNWATGFLTALMLPLVLAGHIHESHMVLKFTTYHYLSDSHMRKVLRKSRMAEAVRHLAFGGLILLVLAFVLVTVPLGFFLFGPERVHIYHWIAFGVVLFSIMILLKIRSNTYSMPLPEELKFLAANQAHPIRINGNRA
jgi:hypothetical protein